MGIPLSLLAEEKKEKKSEDSLEDEIDSLKDDDFPDLVPADEKGEFVDELPDQQDADFPDLVPSDEKGEFIDTLPDQEEADFPDLVRSDETGGVMDEFAFLEEGYVELPARHRQAIGMSPSSISVLTREDIRASGAGTIPDLLRMVPGVEVVAASPFYQAVSTRIHWDFDNNQFLVLIDGREVNLEIMGKSFWEGQVIQIPDIERIEIIRGPGSALYGANALAGVISITTRALSDETGGWTAVYGGEKGIFGLGTSVSGRTGDLRWSAGGGVDLAGLMFDFRELGRRVYRGRLLGECRFTYRHRLTVEAGANAVYGPLPTGLGTLDAYMLTFPIQVGFKTDDLQIRASWMPWQVGGDLGATLELGGAELATFGWVTLNGNMADFEVQWTVPELWKPLLLITGFSLRFSEVRSDELLDAETYSDPASPDYHEPGISRMQLRLGTYLHAEFKAGDWMTVTGGARLDWNTVTDLTVSPRLAAVFRFLDDHFVRLSGGQSYRMPAFYESDLHPPPEYPENGPIQGNDQYLFSEFATRIMGNPDLGNATLTAFEAGYRGSFLDSSLTVTWDLYLNTYVDIPKLETRIATTSTGMIDLDESFLMLTARPENDLIIAGSELALEVRPVERLVLRASWTHREVFFLESGEPDDQTPKNLMTFGGRFDTRVGLTGSLYIFTRSDFVRRKVPNPDGLLAPNLERKLEPVGLILARLGYGWEWSNGMTMQAGGKLFLPVSPYTGDLFSYHEKAGGQTPFGVLYGGDRLGRAIQVYLEGSF